MPRKSLFSGTRPRVLLARLALFVLSCGLALMVAEGVMRVAADTLLSEGEFIALGTVFKVDDPPVGYSLMPNASRVVAKGGAFVVTERISRQGLRDVEHSGEKASGRQRLLILGDSFMYGDGVALAETMPRRLAGLNPGVEVINGGVRGYDLGQEYLYYKDRGRLFKPDVVLLAFFINDLSPDPTMRAVDGDDGLPLFYERRQEVVSRERETAPRGMRGFASSWLRSHSMLYVLLVKRMNDWEGRRRVPGPSKRNNAADIFYLESFRAGQPSGEVSQKWTRALRILDALRRLVVSDGAVLRVIVIPAPWQTSVEEWDRWVGWLGVDPLSLERLKPQTLVRDWCERSGTPCLDLVQDFHASDNGRHYFKNDHHWTAEGHLRAARSVSAFLSAHANSGSPVHSP